MFIIMMLFLLADSPQKLKLEKIHITLIIFFYVSPSSPQLQRLFFLLKIQKNDHFSTSDCQKNTKSSSEKNAKRFSKNFTTQENIKFLILTEDRTTYAKKRKLQTSN